MRTIPGQQIVYPVVSRYGNMQSIDLRLWRQNRPRHNLLSDRVNVRSELQERDIIQTIKAFLGKLRITIRHLIHYVLRCRQFVVGPFFFPPLTRLQLASGCDDLAGGRAQRTPPVCQHNKRRLPPTFYTIQCRT